MHIQTLAYLNPHQKTLRFVHSLSFIFKFSPFVKYHFFTVYNPNSLSRSFSYSRDIIPNKAVEGITLKSSPQFWSVQSSYQFVKALLLLPLPPCCLPMKFDLRQKAKDKSAKGYAPSFLVIYGLIIYRLSFNCF
jgi:hypothetical protein